MTSRVEDGIIFGRVYLRELNGGGQLGLDYFIVQESGAYFVFQTSLCTVLISAGCRAVEEEDEDTYFYTGFVERRVGSLRCGEVNLSMGC